MEALHHKITTHTPFKDLFNPATPCPPGIIPHLNLSINPTHAYHIIPVINLSHTDLDHHTVTLLSLGLNFCPTPDTPDPSEIYKDVENFFRRLRLRDHFYEEHKNAANYKDNPFWKFKKPSTWSPAPGPDPILDSFIHCVRREVLLSRPLHPLPSNLNRRQKRTIKKLGNNKELTIKKADKGSAIVVMNTIDYVSECYKQLSKTDTYQYQDSDLTDTHNMEVHSLLVRMKDAGAIHEKTFAGLVNHKPRTPKFYILPKIHKVHVPGRPILSGNGGPTEKISALVDECIKRYVPLLPSYVKDTTDFINKIEQVDHLPQDTILVTFDVKSLYTNIPNDEGIQAVLEHVLRDKNRTLEVRWIRDLLRLVLFKNNFEFNNHHFLQIGGTAMGTKVAPSLANLFMGKIERKLLELSHLKPLLWLRYIDDIFCIWPHGEQALLTFLELINSHHHTIKFTMESSRISVNYLDTTVLKSDQGLKVTLYTKPTDTHSYLEYTSSHPPHCTKTGPYSQYLRIKRNCTSHEDYLTQATKMTGHYQHRGYPQALLDLNRHKADQITRTTLLQPKAQANVGDHPPAPSILPLILTHNPRNPDIRRIVMRHWPTLALSNRAPTLYQTPPIFGHRRSPNLKDTLVRAKIRYPPPDPGQQGKILRNPPQNCLRQDCPICKKLNREPTISGKCEKQYYRVLPSATSATCEDVHLIYLLSCRHCSDQYVGETKRSFRTRFKEHLADTKHQRETPVAIHFNKEGHSLRDILPKILEKIPSEPDTEHSRKSRRTRESYWIHSLRCLNPLGINIHG